MDLPIEEKVANILVDKQVVQIRPDQPFTWASGIKSPIYCDNRQLLAYPLERKEVARYFAERIKEIYPNASLIAGTATAGIAHAAWVADILDLPMIYVRDKAKGHGKQSQIEGIIKAEDQVVIIEDLISTGGSVINVAKAIESVAQVLGCLSIFDYQLDHARVNFHQANLTFDSLTNFTTLLEVAKENGYIKKQDQDLVIEWYKKSFNTSNS